MKTIDQIITANSLTSIDALRGACEFVNSRTETENQSKTFNQLMIDFLTVKFPDFFLKKTKAPKPPKEGAGNRGKINFKQPTLLWLAVGENSKLPINDALAAWRTEKPELAECPDQTFRDYYNRFNKKGLRALEPGEKSSPKVPADKSKIPAGVVVAHIPEDVEEVPADEPVVEVPAVAPVKVLVNEETRKVKPAGKPAAKSTTPAKAPAKKLVKK
jgi:hypothetical protein